MSRSLLRLPIRTIARAPRKGNEWICRRCLATEADESTSVSFQPAPLKESRPPPTGSPQNYTNTEIAYLRRPLPHKIPVQYLQHSTTEHLPPKEQEQRNEAEAHKPIVGVVVSAGKMQRTVKVRVPRMEWNKRIKKNFRSYVRLLVHDPNNSLVEGDVVSLHRLRVAERVRHVVASIITPFGIPVEDRPPIPTPDERLVAYKEKRFNRLHRRKLRVNAAAGSEKAMRKLQGLGLDPGEVVKPVMGSGVNSKQPEGQAKVQAKSPINERAQRNKGREVKFKQQAEANILEAKDKGERLNKKGIVTGSSLPTQGPLTDPPISRAGQKGARK